MQVTTQIKLDIAQRTPPPTVYAKQDDKGTRYIAATLLNNGAAYTIENGVTARIRILKPDNTAVYTTATIANNTVTAELTSQSLAVPGTAIAELGLYKDNDILTTFSFYLRIERSAISDEEIESRDEFTVLETAIRNAGTATTAANTAAAAATAATTAAETAATAANTAAGRANDAAAAVGEAIDGIEIIDTDHDNDTYIVKFRIINGAPHALVYTL